MRADKLLEVVKKNNAEYRKDTVKKNMTKEFSDKQLKTYCGWIAETVNWQIEKHSDFDFETVGCVLGNLKIVEKNSTNYGGFDCKSGVMSINPKMIKATGKKMTMKNLYLLTRQYICSSRDVRIWQERILKITACHTTFRSYW